NPDGKSGEESLQKKGARLATREVRRASLHERGDALAEVLAAEGVEHLGVGHPDRRLEVAELIRPELPLHDVERARRALGRELARILPAVRQQRVGRERAVPD